MESLVRQKYANSNPKTLENAGKIFKIILKYTKENAPEEMK